jgi:hypothetical protein
MTVGRAKAIISYVWLILGGTIFGLVVYLTLIGKFRFSPTNWDAGLSWVITDFASARVYGCDLDSSDQPERSYGIKT